MNSAACWCAATNERTSSNKDGSSEQRFARNKSLRSGPMSMAEKNAALTCCQRSASMITGDGAFITALPAVNFAIEPGTGKVPFSLHGGERFAHKRGDLFHCQPAEEPQLDNPAFLRIHRSQCRERIIQRQYVEVRLFRRKDRLIQ